MIRLAISCDICGAEKKQTNHWFVAYEQNGELRISGWSSRFRKKGGSRHLCGQTCLHKLVDEFMAKMIEEDRATAELGRIEAAGPEHKEPPAGLGPAGPRNDPYGGLRNQKHTDYRPEEVVGRHVDHRLPNPRWMENRAAVGARMVEVRSASANASASSWAAYEDEFGSSARLIATPPMPVAVPAAMPADEAPRYAAHQWRASAWERERERGQQGEAGSRRH